MMTDEILKQIAENYGTPAYVFDVPALQERIRSAKKIAGQKVHLCFSIKANPFLIPAMLEVTEHLEVCSPGELDLCRKLKVPGEKIVYSGVNKTAVDIADAVADHVGIYTAESLLHAELLQEAAHTAGKKLPVLLRLNAGSQFGMSVEDLFSVIAHRTDYPDLVFEGIHYFAGTQRKKLTQQAQELQVLKELFARVRSEYGFTLRKLEYGPGLPVPYFEGEDFSDTLSPLRMLAPALQEVSEWAELTVEMGRFFTSECGYYLTKVMDQKQNKGTFYSILDGGMNHVTYLGQIMGMKNPVIRHLKMTSDRSTLKAQDWALCGSLCTTADVLTRQTSFTDLEKGDILAFCNIGAYSVTEGIYLFLSRSMPVVLLYRGMQNDQADIQVARTAMETSTLNLIQQ
ncbi:MAG: alanine racemase [Butyrivibrio sp.]|nr:alanine racemase [Butyrivibrio sp.]